MARRPVVSRHLVYDEVTYRYIDVDAYREHTDVFYSYPAGLSTRTIERHIEAYIKRSDDGWRYHFMHIANIERKEETLELPIELYIQTWRDYKED